MKSKNWIALVMGAALAVAAAAGAQATAVQISINLGAGRSQPVVIDSLPTGDTGEKK